MQISVNMTQRISFSEAYHCNGESLLTNKEEIPPSLPSQFTPHPRQGLELQTMSNNGYQWRLMVSTRLTRTHGHLAGRNAEIQSCMFSPFSKDRKRRISLQAAVSKLTSICIGPRTAMIDHVTLVKHCPEGWHCGTPGHLL